jgi:hypothetical protein
MVIAAGTRFGPYEVVAPIGAGGMGEVWRGRDTRLDRSVAIKILPAEFAENAQFKLRFEREAKTISQLNHPHICTLYDVGDNYLVMELLRKVNRSPSASARVRYRSSRYCAMGCRSPMRSTKRRHADVRPYDQRQERSQVTLPASGQQLRRDQRRSAFPYRSTDRRSRHRPVDVRLELDGRTKIDASR